MIIWPLDEDSYVYSYIFLYPKMAAATSMDNTFITKWRLCIAWDRRIMNIWPLDEDSYVYSYFYP